MRLTIACVGRPKGFAADAVADYLKRLARYGPAHLVPVRAERDPDRDPIVARRREGERLLAACPKGSRIVALDVRGQIVSSQSLARRLGQLADQGVRDLTFLVGGPVGLADEVREQADWILSLSSMTLAHEVALVVLCEQLYRAGTIQRGERYHK